MSAIAIVGSREYPDLSEVRRYVRRLPSGTVLISGGAKGVDQAAAAAARERGFEVKEFLPDIPRYGSPAAYYHRNVQIVQETKAQGGRLVAFAARKADGGITDGTGMTLGIAGREGVHAEVIECRIKPATLALLATLRKAYDAYGGAPVARRKERHVAYQQARTALWHKRRDLIEWLEFGLTWLEQHDPFGRTEDDPALDGHWGAWQLALVTLLAIEDAMNETRIET